DLAGLNRCRVEDAVAAVHHVVVERDDHQCGVGHDPAELARVERPVLDRLAGPKRAELLDYLTGRQHWQSGRHRHDRPPPLRNVPPYRPSLRPCYPSSRAALCDQGLKFGAAEATCYSPARCCVHQPKALSKGVLDRGEQMIGARIALGIACALALTGCASAHY